MRTFNRNRTALGEIPQAYEGCWDYMAQITDGGDYTGTSLNNYSTYGGYITIKLPIYIKNVLWDIGNAATWTLKINSVSYGSVVTGGQTADVSWTVNKYFQGMYYFEMTRNTSGKWDYRYNAAYTGTYFSLPTSAYWNGSLSATYNLPVKLVFNPLRFSPSLAWG